MEAAVEKRSSTDQSKEEWTGADEGGQEEETEFCKETVESDATPPHRMAAQYPIDGSSPPSSQDSLDMMLTYADDDALEAWAKQQEKKGSFCGLVFDSPLLSSRRAETTPQGTRLGRTLAQYLPGVPDSEDRQRAQTTADSSRHERGRRPRNIRDLS